MPFFVATYDLKKTSPDPYRVFIKQAEAWGWSSTILERSGSKEPLPNTTLVGTFASLRDAVYFLEQARVAAANEISGQVYVQACYVSEVVGDAFIKPNEAKPDLLEALTAALQRSGLS